ncbi:hypothetical protein Zm00014a_011127 [Zea mays]|nr:hypothetical protein Zm00014a_011127 [Zea mays]
MSKRQS